MPSPMRSQQHTGTAAVFLFGSSFSSIGYPLCDSEERKVSSEHRVMMMSSAISFGNRLFIYDNCRL